MKFGCKCVDENPYMGLQLTAEVRNLKYFESRIHELKNQPLLSAKEIKLRRDFLSFLQKDLNQNFSIYAAARNFSNQHLPTKRDEKQAKSCICEELSLLFQALQTIL